MTVETAIVTRLRADAGVMAIAGTRTYLLRLPQTPTFPVNRVQLIGEIEFAHLRGTGGIYRARVQVDSIAGETSGTDPYGTVSSLADAVNDALSGFRGLIGSFDVAGITRDAREVMYEAAELREVRMRQDYIVWFKQ